MLGIEVLHLSLLKVGVALDLVDRRHHRGALEKRGEVLDHEVADPNRADLAVSEQRLQSTVGLQGLVERRRQRLVQDQEVDLLDGELAGALLEAVQRLVVSVVADPDLGLQEELRAVQVGAVHRLADLALVAVGRRRVDVPVPRASAARTASRVSSGGVWKTPRPSAGISTPLLRVIVSMSGPSLDVGGKAGIRASPRSPGSRVLSECRKARQASAYRRFGSTACSQRTILERAN